MPLPINVDDLITGQSIEWERLEFKQGWNPISILHSICAFANDINNWGGGYIVIGIKEKNGRPQLPPQGLDPQEIDNMQKKLIELCHHITPHYFPLAVPVIYRKKHLLVLWVPGGDMRPYKAAETLVKKPRTYYYVRRYSTTVKASHQEELKKEKIIVRDYRNRQIGDFLKELELTEGRSTGFPKIRRKLKQNGSPGPLFQTDEQLTYFLTVLYSHPDFTGQDKDFKENSTVNATVNATVNETQRKILEEIEKKSSITYDQLADLLKKERTTIYRNIKKIVEMNIIKRLGSDKNGYRELNRDMLSAMAYRDQEKK